MLRARQRLSVPFPGTVTTVRTLAIIVSAIILALVLLALPFFAPHVGTDDRGQSHMVQRARTIGATSKAATVGAQITVKTFVHAFKAQDYNRMWQLLAPATKRQWGGYQVFRRFYQLKFLPVRTAGWALGTPNVTGTRAAIPLSVYLRWTHHGPDDTLSLFRNLPVNLSAIRGTWRINNAGPLDRFAPVIPAATPAVSTLHVPILMYHHVSNSVIARSQLGNTIDDTSFARQLAYITTHGFHTIRMIDLFNALYYGVPLPPHPVILTFDDGYLDNYTDAFPLLQRYHVIGEFNIIAAYPGINLGVNSYMTWPQIDAMSEAGMDIQSHTVDHQDLGILPLAHVDYELRFSRAIIAAHIHRAVQFMAYPSGEPFRSGNVAGEERVSASLRRFGYIGALLDPLVNGSTQRACCPYELTRTRISNNESLGEFIAAVQ